MSSDSPPIAERGTPLWMVEKLMELGWTRTAAIALTAHVTWESGGTGGTTSPKGINWAAHGDKSKKDGKFHSHGGGQWNDRHGRYQNMLMHAADRDVIWSDPEAQLTFLDQELRTTERGVRKKLQAATSLDEAMQAGLKFWRPSMPHMDRRLARAARLDKEVPNETV